MTLALPPLHTNSGWFERAEQVDVLRAAGADRADGVGVLALEHRGEAGQLLDVLLEHDVGRVEAALRAGLRVVVDLDDHRRAVGEDLRR